MQQKANQYKQNTVKAFEQMDQLIGSLPKSSFKDAKQNVIKEFEKQATGGNYAFVIPSIFAIHSWRMLSLGNF